MFKIVHLDGTQKIPDDDICYILAKSGTYLKKKVGLIESLTPVKNISILEDVQPYARMNIPKLTGEDFGKVMSFFKKVYEEFRSEAIVLLYYNSKKLKYKLYVPNQKVNGASVDYVKGVSIKDHIQIGTIHSHADFSAFHSGVDDSDEEHFDGMHITIGNNMDNFPSISASIVVNGTRFAINPIDYITNLEIVEYTNYFPHMFRPSFTEINGVREYKNTVKTKLGYQLMVSAEEKEFDPKWLEMIEDSRPLRTSFDFAGYSSLLEDYIGRGRDYRGSETLYPSSISLSTKKHKNEEKEEREEKNNQEGFSDIWDSVGDRWGMY